MDERAFRTHRGWFFVLLLILLAQGGMTLRLFSPSWNLEAITNDQPILSGRHPLHLYHGLFGARIWLERGTSCGYDPAYQVGYPKTPVFDSGSRPAELFLLLSGGKALAAYKIGVAVSCLLVPLAFALMGRGLGLCAGASCLAALLGSALWWSPTVRELLESGELDLLMGGLCMLAHLSWWVRFTTTPWIDSWLVLTGTIALAWFLQPFIVLSFLPVLLLYYFWVAFRHGVAWHLSIVAAAIIGVLVNYSWLSDWVRYSWIRSALEGDGLMAMPLESLFDQWELLLPTDPLSLGIGALGLLGLFGMMARQASTGVLVLFAALGLLTLAIGSKSWSLLHDLGTDRLLPLAVWIMVCPCAYFLARLAEKFGSNLGYKPLGVIWLLIAMSATCWMIGLPHYWIQQPPFTIGYTAEQLALSQILRQTIGPQARILWEDRSQLAPGTGWGPLLHLQTDRDFIGGLDPNGQVEHMFFRLLDGKLAQRPIAEWTDEDLKRFCERYNIGWVVCWSEAAQKRFQSFPLAKYVQPVQDETVGSLFVLNRGANLFLKGQGRVVQCDWQRVALADVIPEDGEIVLSLHHHTGWRIAPGYVQMERDLDPFDPIPFIRLKVPGPISRLTLTWENR